MNRTPLTVGDLYCGAGGFSEGFRQAGFKILWGVDNWEPAVTTFKSNFPDAKVLTDDVLSLDYRRLEPVDVLIGSPPCTHFSLANKGGNGDVSEGLRLVRRFMDAVDGLRPRYYVMENVPHLDSIFERTIPQPLLERYFPDRVVLNSADFALPQNRRRLFLGRFPIPQATTTAHVPMRKVIHGLPYPMASDLAKRERKVRDPLYGFSIPVSKLTEHFSDTTLDRTEIREALREKQGHSWYGPMRFPDSLDLPSRTIDTITGLSRRQSIVVADSRGGRKVYRGLTGRERACLQGFPITYQFWGKYLAHRSSLVGNAVPPPLARAIALSVREDMGMLGDDSHLSFSLPDVLPPTAPAARQRSYRFSLRRTYRRFVPGTFVSRRARIDFDNLGNRPAVHPAGRRPHLVEWRPVLYLGYARDYVSFRLDVTTASRIALYVCLRTGQRPELVERVVSIASKLFARAVPDASTLQAIWAGRMRSPMNPDWILNQTARICREAVVRVNRTGENAIEAGECTPFLAGTRLSGGKDSRRGRWKKKRINLYMACAAVALSVAALFANRGTLWLRTNWGKHYAVQSLDLTSELPDKMRGVVPIDVLSDFCTARRSLPHPSATRKEN